MMPLAMADQPKVAVLGFQGAPDDVCGQLKEVVSSVLHKTRAIAVVDANGAAVSPDSGLIDPDMDAKIGKDIQFLVYGDVKYFSNDQVTVPVFGGAPKLGFKTHIDVRMRVTDVALNKVIFDQVISGNSEQSGLTSALDAQSTLFVRRFMPNVHINDAMVSATDPGAKVVLINPGDLASVEEGDYFVIEQVLITTASDGRQREHATEVCRCKIKSVSPDELQAAVGGIHKSGPFGIGKPEFKADDSMIGKIQKLLDVKATLRARVIIE